MLKRIITAIVAILLMIPILMYSHTWIFPVAAGFLSLVALFEIAGCIHIKKKISLMVVSFSYIFLVFSAVSAYYITNKSFSIDRLTTIVLALTFFYIFLNFVFTMLSLGKTKFIETAEFVALTIYVLIGFISITLLRKQMDMGGYLFGLIFIGAWATDTGAYFVGVLIGKHKLIPSVSPKKTIEGAIGGILGSIVGFVIYALILQTTAKIEVNYLTLIILAAIISVVSQFGDLVASYLKRECNIKDFGHLFPGHGGVLDRFDSIIAVAPTIYFALLLLEDYCWIFRLPA